MENIVETMKKSGVKFDVGLTQEEIVKIESKFGFQFPPDLKLFYQTALPISANKDKGEALFSPWRHALHDETASQKISNFKEWVFEGILFDIVNNNFWMKGWGDTPSDSLKQHEIARQHFDAAPFLIPIYQHRCMPAFPVETGNPVFSIWQTDIIYFGLDLTDYLQQEFKLPISAQQSKSSVPKRIEFWSEMIELNK